MDVGTGIAIAAPNAVAALAIWVSWKSQGRELRHARQLTDLESVRTVLDDAAVALHRAAYALDEVRSNLTQYGPHGFFKTEDRAKPYADLIRIGRDLDVLLERLKIRFERGGEIVTAFETATEATLAVTRALNLVKLEEPAEADDQFAREQVHDFLREKQTEIEQRRKDFDAQRAKFIDAAQHTGGADLPMGDRRHRRVA